jgi:cyclopropane-fatty-acyl-phospholipid synthase
MSWFRKTVLRGFSSFRRGSLEVVLPDGKSMRFGGLGRGLSARIEVRDERFFRSCVLFGPIGFGEAYLEGFWETPDLVSVISFFILNAEETPGMETDRKRSRGGLNLLNLYNRFLHRRRPNSLNNARANIHEHYDLGNEFFRLWLDPSMTYSSAWFDPPELTLEQAQLKKYDRLCRKLQISPGHQVLEIGSGWGGFSIYAARAYQCRIKTITLSEAQLAEAQKRVSEAGLAEQIEVELVDYRDVTGTFDRIVSIEMIEAVGDRYLEDYFGKCHELLKPDGLLGLQMITCPDRQYHVLRDGVDFIQKHIFPGSLLVSVRRVVEAVNATGDLNLLDYADMTPFYAKTLRLWRERFEEVRGEIVELGASETFLRKWRYYLAYCEAAFGSRHIGVAQAIFTRPDNLSISSPAYQLTKSS